MTLSLEQLSSRMRRGENIPLRETAQVVLALSVPSILQQMVVTAMEYIDAAMVGHIGAEATAAIGIVSSSTWLLHGILVGLYTAFSIQITQSLAADARRQLGQLQAAVPDHLNTLALRLLGDALAGRGETALAIEAYRACCDYVEKNKLLNEQRHIYFGLARLYTRTNRYADATTYFERAEEANRLFTLQRNAALISQFRVKYETREKEQANQLLRSEVQLKQRTLEFYTVFGIALILLGGIFALWIVMRHRALKMQHEADNKQHELDLIRQQEAQLIIEEKEHQLRLMLNERQELNRKNEELRDKLEHSDAQSCLQEVINSLSPRLLTLEEEQNFRHQFGIIHPQFLSRLRDICPTITRSEELLAMLIRLKLNTEEIAFALGNNRPSVHSSRSRLRKKMEIDKGISLEEYFRNL